MSLVANFLENTTVKEIYKSANISQSYEEMYSGTVFRHSVITNYTVNHKKRDVLFLTITLANLNGFL